MKQYKLRIGMVALAACMAACSGFDDEAAPRTGKDYTAGTPVEVGLSLRVAALQSADGAAVPITRAPLDVDQTGIHNVYAFQFDGTGDDALLVCPFYYIDEQAITDAAGVPLGMPMIDSEEALHRLVFVANVNSDQYDWNMLPSQNTYADLKSRHRVLMNEETTYDGDRRNLVMSGSVITPVHPDVLVDGDDQYDTELGGGVPMVRSLACVELDLGLDEALTDWKIVSVQLRDVSSRFDLLDAELSTELGTTGVYPSALSTIDYAAEVDTEAGLVLPGDANRQTYRWFVPRNTRGTVSGSTSKFTKNHYAIPGATYFEILATDGSGGTARYRVYPGADEVSDFNVIPNHKYSHTYTITGMDDAVDARIENFGDVMFRGQSNCYLLNPPPAGFPAREFSVPVTQVNRYWLPDYDGYGGLGENKIKADDDWTVDLLWQDAAGIVRPVVAADANHVTIPKSTGTGGDDHFTVRVPAGATHGNFVVVIRKDDPSDHGILWSWHLWVTGYDPDPRAVPIRGDKFIYPVPGGQVERYYGKRFGYPGDDSRTWDGTTWSPTVTSTATLAQSVVMDRYVGALSNTYVAKYGRGTLFYQWGRKDPLPGNIALYKIDGTEITDTNGDFPGQLWKASNANMVSAPALSGNSQITAAIANPMRFFSNMVGLGSASYGWNDSQSTSDTYPTKSIYDPCPEGWRMLSQGSWNDFRHGNTANSTGRGLGYSNGARYYPYIKENGEDYSASNYAFYSGTGIRGGGGTLASTGGFVYVWSSYLNSSTAGRNLYVYSTSLTVVNTRPCSTGLTVRCASE